MCVCADFTSALAVEPRNSVALSGKARLDALVAQRNEKLKTEMLGGRDGTCAWAVHVWCSVCV